MNRFDPKRLQGKFRAMQKTQYVLITDNGKERTSHVTDGRIMKAVYEIEANGYVTLERCTPVRLVREAECFAITFYEDSRVAIYFRVRKTMLRMVKGGFSCDAAADLMCDFFCSARLPDMTLWTCEELKPASRKSESNLSVDGEDFRYFGSADVVAALENIIDGKSVWMLYDFTGENGGYINIRRCGDDSTQTAKYEVECVRWTEPTPTGYRAVISDAAPLRGWLWDLVDAHKFPDPTPEWESFDVTDYFQRLTFRFLDKEDKLDKSDNDER
ncbi:hypothetical protein [uncultured Bacteroides sp.]|uniref:hypothetical protein n=1 Tax=uncultured Bacteroides sp. TaxID=162156 RepID=UPI002617A4F0|nr:hypothetical protein [uncultured Bacteroides sp.]